MRMVDLIEKKRDGKSFTQKKFSSLSMGLQMDTIPDYQMSALVNGRLFSRHD